jgi:hypothetical protein
MTMSASTSQRRRFDAATRYTCTDHVWSRCFWLNQAKIRGFRSLCPLGAIERSRLCRTNWSYQRRGLPQSRGARPRSRRWGACSKRADSPRRRLVATPSAWRGRRLVAGAAVVATRSSSGIRECACCRRRERARDNGSRNLPLHAQTSQWSTRPSYSSSQPLTTVSCSLPMRDDRRAARTADGRRWLRTVEICATQVALGFASGDATLTFARLLHRLCATFAGPLARRSSACGLSGTAASPRNSCSPTCVAAAQPTLTDCSTSTEDAGATQSESPESSESHTSRTRGRGRSGACSCIYSLVWHPSSSSL